MAEIDEIFSLTFGAYNFTNLVLNSELLLIT